MRGRFVYTLKNYQQPTEIPKTPFVARGYNDRKELHIVYDSSTIRPSSVRVVLLIAAVCGFRLFLHDVTQAYTKSKHKLTREVYLRIHKRDLVTFDMQEDEILELLKPLYGLCNAGDYWAVALEEHIINDLGMQSVVSDPALFAKIEEGKLTGLSGVQVDDCLNAGLDSFEKHTMKTLELFDLKPRVYDSFDFFGTQIRTIAPSKFCIG